MINSVYSYKLAQGQDEKRERSSCMSPLLARGGRNPWRVLPGLIARLLGLEQVTSRESPFWLGEGQSGVSLGAPCRAPSMSLTPKNVSFPFA